MASDENEIEISPISSELSPLESLLKEVFASASKHNWTTKLPTHDKIQQIKQLIIKFQTCTKYANPTKIWEIDADLYLIRLENIFPTMYITKCTLQQAIHLNITQIPLVPHITSSISELDKDTLRISSLFSKFPEASPFVFEVQTDVNAPYISATRAYKTQQTIINILLIHAPLIPMSTRKALEAYYAALSEQNSDNENSSPEGFAKVYTLAYMLRF